MGPGQEALEIPRAGAGEAVVHPLSSAELCPVPSSSLRTRMYRTRQWVGADLVMTRSWGCYECGVGGDASKRQCSFAACARKIFFLSSWEEEVPEVPTSGQFSVGTVPYLQGAEGTAWGLG